MNDRYLPYAVMIFLVIMTAILCSYHVMIRREGKPSEMEVKPKDEELTPLKKDLPLDAGRKRTIW